MAKNYGPKKDMVFHNALVTAGPVRLTVDEEPKWIPAKNNYVVEITILTQGQAPQAVSYWAENNRCGEFFKGQKGRTLTVVFSGGGKGPAKETGVITYVGESAAPQQQQAPPPAYQPPTPQQAPPPPYQPPPPSAPPGQRPPPPSAEEKLLKATRGLHDGKAHIARNESILKVVLRRAMSVKTEFELFTSNLEEGNPNKGMKMSDPLFQTCVGTLLYGVSSQGIDRDMPTNIDFKTLEIIRKPGAPAPTGNTQQPPPPPQCPTHKINLNPDGGCPTCIHEVEVANSDDVPF